MLGSFCVSLSFALLTLNHKDMLKTKRQEALLKVNFEHAIEKLGGD